MIDKKLKHKRMSVFTKGFFVALAYGVTSTSITFFNKAVLSVYVFKFSMSLTLAQMIFSLVLTLFMKRFGLIDLADFDMNTARACAPLAFFFSQEWYFRG